MSRYTDEELAGLTPEERAALEEMDAELDQSESSEDDDYEGVGDTDAGHDDPDGGDDDTTADDGADDSAGDDDDSAQGAAPLLSPDVPEDIEQKLADIAKAKEELIAQFDDGELTAKEYQCELDKLSKQEREIEQSQFKAQLAREMAEQQARNEWLRTVNEFLSEHSEYREKPRLYKLLDAEVRELASKEENQGLSGREILRRAHENIAVDLGLEAKQAQPAKRASGKKPINAPPSLARVPASDITDTNDGRWAKLDRLAETDPLRLEHELARMSEADRDAYLAR